jgi:peptide/nickel transport system permease protein
MYSYLFRRLLMAVPLLIGVTVLLFVLNTLSPIDPIAVLIPPDMQHMADASWVARERARLGLDQPLPVRYARWMQELLQGNLGYSIRTGQPVTRMIIEKLPATVELTLAALLLSVVVGIPVGVISAVKQYSPIDNVLTLAAFTLVSIPGFFLGLVFIYIFALNLKWLPTSGISTLGQPFSASDHLRHLILPAVVLGAEGTASMIRFSRASMLEVMHQDYVVAARARGLTVWRAISRHAFRNSLLPIVTILGLRLPFLFSGAVVVERVFFWPGVGTLIINAVDGNDHPVILGAGLVMAGLVFLATLLTDLSYAAIDPRIRIA